MDKELYEELHEKILEIVKSTLPDPFIDCIEPIDDYHCRVTFSPIKGDTEKDTIIFPYGKFIPLNVGETKIFPDDKYKVGLWTVDEEIPRLHVIDSDGIDVSYFIENGRRNKVHTLMGIEENDESENLKRWLKEPSPMMTGLTNQEHALYKWENMTNKDFRDIARVGFMKDDYEVYIRTDDKEETPHLHIRNRKMESNGETSYFETCIKLESNEYCLHDPFVDKLNEEEQKWFMEFMQEKPLTTGDHYNNHYEFAIDLWNANNSGVQATAKYENVDGEERVIIPDYAHI